MFKRLFHSIHCHMIKSFVATGIWLLLLCVCQAQQLPKSARITVDASKVENKISRLIYGSNLEDVNHEIYGGFYDQRVFGESFEEPATGVDHSKWKRYAGFWVAEKDGVSIVPGRNATSEVVMNGSHTIPVEPDHSAKLIYDLREYADASVQTELRFTGKGENGSLLVRVKNPGVGDDVFDGYEISLTSDGKKLVLGKHVQDYKMLKAASVDCDPEKWNTLKVTLSGALISVFLNEVLSLTYTDHDAPLLKGKIGLRTWRSALEFRNVVVEEAGKMNPIPLVLQDHASVSYNWDPVRDAGVSAHFQIDSSSAFNGKCAQLVELMAGNGKVGVANRGLNRWGIAVRANQQFQGRLYLKANLLEGPVTVALESADGQRTYASTELNGITKNWGKYGFSLLSKESDRNARLVVYIKSKGKL